MEKKHMGNVTFAIYKGKEYSAGIREDKMIVLRSYDKNDIQKGFIEKINGNRAIYVKYVKRKEIDEIFDRRTFAVYKGNTFEVVDENQEQILIVTMNGDWHEWERIGMTCIDKGVFQKWINKSDAEIYVEKTRI
jgi:hypothetical protein